MKSAARQLCSLLLTILAVGSAAPRVAAAEPAAAEGERLVWVLRFDLGGIELSETHRVMLDEVAQALVEDPRLWAQIVGHSDSLGPEPVNLQVSRERAEAVAAYLARIRGITQKRMVTEAKGSLRPVAADETAEGQQRNRRVVVALQDEAAAERRRARGIWILRFDFGGSQLSSAAMALLNEVAGELRRDPDLEAVVVGHSDSLGQEPVNLQVSRERAESAKSYLTRREGIAGERIRTEGKGSLRPVASNETPEGQWRNRRVVIALERASPSLPVQPQPDVAGKEPANVEEETPPTPQAGETGLLPAGSAPSPEQPLDPGP